MKKAIWAALLVGVAQFSQAVQPVASQYRNLADQDSCLAMQRASNFLLESIQRREGKTGWSWKIADGPISQNVSGLAALALLDAYQASGDVKLLSAVRDVADALVQASSGWTSENQPFKPDIELLARLGRQLNDDRYLRAAGRAFALVLQRSPSAEQEVERIFQGRQGSAPHLLGFDVALAIRAATAVGERPYANGLADAVLSRSRDWLPAGKMDRFGLVSVAAMVEAIEALDAPHYAAVIERYREILAGLQQPNGSWVLNETQPSAYAALALAGGAPRHRQAWLKAVDWLKSTMLKSGSLASYNDYMPEPFVGDIISEVHAEALSALARACGQR